MKDQKFDIGSLRIASPCSVGWETMAGDERTRHCDQCNSNVFNLSELTTGEVERLVSKNQGRLCVRMYRRFDGTVLTKDCPVGLRAVRKRMAMFAGATLSTILGLFSIGFGQKGSETLVDGSTSELVTVNNRADKYNLTGVVTDSAGAVVPNVRIFLYKDGKKVWPRDARSDKDGSFSFNSVSNGMYRIEVPAKDGFYKLVVNNVKIESDKVTNVRLKLQAAYVEVLVGAVGEDPVIDMTTAGPSTRVITREMLDRMPGRRPW